MNSANYITVAEFQTMNPELDFTGFSDPTISGMIRTASQGMDNYLQYSLAVEDIVAEKNEALVNSHGNLMIFTRKFPIISVSAVSLKLGTVNTDLSLTDGAGNARYEIPDRARNIVYPYQELAFTGTFSIRNFYAIRGLQIYTKVSYRAGFVTIPDDVKDACSLWTRDIFTRQANPMDLKSINQGAISMSFRDLDPDTGDARWLKQAKSILSSYKKYTA